MHMLVIEEEAYKELMSQLEEIKQGLKKQDRQYDEGIYDNDSLCALLKISKRTLQSWRDNGIIGFSQINGKILYSRKDVEELLANNYRSAFSRKSGRTNAR